MCDFLHRVCNVLTFSALCHMFALACQYEVKSLARYKSILAQCGDSVG